MTASLRPPAPERPARQSYPYVDLDEVVLTSLTEAGDRLLIEVWHPGQPVRRVERD